MSPTPRRRMLERLKVVDRHAAGVRLAGAAGEVEITTPIPGVFRLRAAAGGKPGSMAEGRSLALVDPDRVPAPAEIRVTTATVMVASKGAVLRWNLRTGAWTLSDGRLRVVESGPGGCGFEEGRARVGLRLAEREAIFGLGETTGAFDKRGLVREFWNIDVLGHAPAIHPSLRNLYVSIPFALTIRDGRAGGWFWDNPRRQTWDLGQGRPDVALLEAEGGPIDLYLFAGPTVEGVLSDYTELTGRTPMPPLWSLGYQQSRYSYETAERVEEVAGEFRRRRIPCDVLYLDIHHMDGYRVFTWGKGFPDPAGLMRRLERRGFRAVAIVDPGVKEERRFGVWRRGVAADAFVKEAGGKRDVRGEVWPGAARFPDFLNPAARAWWAGEQAVLSRAGVAGIWNDMNEPANFARPDKTLPPDAVHRTPDGPRRHLEVHNLYGMEMSRASREGLLAARPDRRPFVVTRATYAGGQRHAVVWTGDNTSSWDHLRDAVQMVQNLGVSGVAHCGCDVGGFLDNATPELFVRWLQFGVFTAFFRNHSNIGTVAQEPWAFGPEVEAIAREVISLRYRLLPWYYGLMVEACATGAPPLRPLLWHHANDPLAVRRGDQFLVGRDLLVAPVLEQGSRARAVYLPNEVWYDFETGERIEGGRHWLVEAPLGRIPMFVRGGAILPVVPEAQHTGGLDLSVVTVNVWPGLNPGVTWYEDDGLSLGFERGGFHRRRWTLGRMRRRQVLELGAAEGARGTAVRAWRIVLHDVGAAVRVRVDGKPVEVFRDAEAGVALLVIENTESAVRVEWGPA